MARAGPVARVRPIACLFGALLALGAAAADAPSSTLAGVYSEAQAARGAEAYARSCATCHGADLTGSFEVPGLRGYFLARWSGAPLDQLFDYVSSAMPLSAPGALSAAANAEIIAYLLQSNGLPAGSVALAADESALRAITIRGPAGPQ